MVWKKTSAYKELSAEDLAALSAEDRDHTYQRGDRYVLDTDGTEYMNHSCDPTAWWSGDDCITTRREIHMGEEITYDYATSEADPWWRSEWACRCGAALCRGVVTGRDCLCPKFQDRYRDHLPKWTEAFIARHRGPRGWCLRTFYALADVKRKGVGRSTTFLSSKRNK